MVLDRKAAGWRQCKRWGAPLAWEAGRCYQHLSSDQLEQLDKRRLATKDNLPELWWATLADQYPMPASMEHLDSQAASNEIKALRAALVEQAARIDELLRHTGGHP